MWRTTLGGPPRGPWSPSRGPQVSQRSGKKCKNSQKLYKKFTCRKIPQIITPTSIFGHFGHWGGPWRAKIFRGGWRASLILCQNHTLFQFVLALQIYIILLLEIYHTFAQPCNEFSSLPTGCQSHVYLVRFPNPLAFGSGLGLQTPYRRGIFLSTPLAENFSGKVWFIGCLLDFCTSHEATCVITLFFDHWSCRQHSISILPRIATFSSP